MFFSRRIIRFLASQWHKIFALVFMFFAIVSTTFGTPQLFIEPKDSYTPVLNAINSAQHSINMEIYLITDPKIIDALKKAQRRGVNVRIILEKNVYKQKDKSVRLAKILRKQGLHIHFSDPGFFALTHEKSFAVDHKKLLIMTLNQSYSAYHFNREYGLIDDRPEDINEFELLFEGDWQHHYPAAHIERLVWSPNNSTQKLIQLIQSATKTLFLESEILNDKAVENLLIQKAQQGVDVRIIMPKQKVKRSQLHILKHGVSLRILTPNRTLHYLYMHAKLIIADNKKAYFGSENLSSYSLQMNRECGVLIKDPSMLKKLRGTFRTDWKAAKPFNISSFNYNRHH